MSNLIDLSHAIRNGEATYPGLPAPEIGDFLSHEDSVHKYSSGTVFHIGKIKMVTNCGTYVDSPFHRYPQMPDIARLCLTRLADLEAVCVSARTKAIDATVFEGIRLRGKAVLVQTGWSRFWGSEKYFHDHPFLTGAAAEYLAAERVAHVGIDSLNIDSTGDGNRPVHSCLLAAGIPITEHLTNLQALPAEGFRYFAVPAKVCGAGSFPVRAFALTS